MINKNKKLHISIKLLAAAFSMLISNELNARLKMEETNGVTIVEKKILVINASPNLIDSNSRALSSHLIEQLNKRYPGKYTPIYRDLVVEDMPYINSKNIEVITSGTATSTAAQSLKMLSDTLINELKKSDVIVIAMPMHNFTVPAPFKAYIDLILRARETFSYTSEGPKGILADRPVILIITSGGCHKGKDSDHITSYVRAVLNFIGIKNLTFIVAEGLAMQDKKDTSLLEAKEEIEKLVDIFQIDSK